MLADIFDTLVQSGRKPRLTELGKIKIGGLGETRNKSAGGTYRVPRKDDHFTITTLNRTQAGDLAPDEALMHDLAKSGYADKDNKIRRIPISVLSNDLDDIIQAGWCYYKGKKCVARSDGKTTTWYQDDKGNRLEKPLVEPFDGEILKAKVGDQVCFKLHAIFNCVIGAERGRWGGVYKFRTTSKISFEQLYGSLLQVSRLTGGVLEGMPLIMVVRPMHVNTPNGNATTAHVVHVELHGSDLVKLQEQALNRAKYQLAFQQEVGAAVAQYRKLLTGPGDESALESEDVGQEFHPEASSQQAMTDKLTGSAGREEHREDIQDAHIDELPDAVARLLHAFDGLKVTRQMIEERISCDISEITDEHMAQLREKFRRMNNDGEGWNVTLQHDPNSKLEQVSKEGDPSLQISDLSRFVDLLSTKTVGMSIAAIKKSLKSWAITLEGSPALEKTSIEQRSAILKAIEAGEFDLKLGVFKGQEKKG